MDSQIGLPLDVRFERRICWLTFASLRILSRFAIQIWLTVIGHVTETAKPFEGRHLLDHQPCISNTDAAKCITLAMLRTGGIDLNPSITIGCIPLGSASARTRSQKASGVLRTSCSPSSCKRLRSMGIARSAAILLTVEPKLVHPAPNRAATSRET